MQFNAMRNRTTPNSAQTWVTIISKRHSVSRDLFVNCLPRENSQV